MLPSICPSDTDQLTSIQDINLASSSFVIPWSYLMTALWSSCQASDKQALCSLHWLCSLLHGWGVTGVNDGNIILTLSHPLLKIKILLFICNIDVTNPIWPLIMPLSVSWHDSLTWSWFCGQEIVGDWAALGVDCDCDHYGEAVVCQTDCSWLLFTLLQQPPLQHCTHTHCSIAQTLAEKADARPTYSIST